MKIFDCEQNTDEWFRARMGIPTASEFKTLIGVNKDAKDKKTRTLYMQKLAGEILTGEPMERYSNPYLERGHEMEGKARDLYRVMTDAVDAQRVGFIVNGQKGCSPDALIGTNGMVEIKTQAAHLLIDTLLKDEFPPEHKAQTQGGLWVAEREWIDIAIYWPKLPLFVKRSYRDEAYIAKLSDAVDQFNAELAEMVERVRAYDGQKAEAA
jgi:hypothetical protein